MNIIGRKYKYPLTEEVFTVSEDRGGSVRFECGHWCTDLVFEDLIDIETGIQNYRLMKKLPKPYEASQNRISITVEGQRYEVAQLLKSGIPNQSVLLIGQDEKWREIQLSPLCITNDLDAFLNLFTTGEIQPSDIGFSDIDYRSTPADTQLKHADFERLEFEFPAYPYFMISKLYREVFRYRSGNLSELRIAMRRVQESGLTIPEWIKQSENGAAEFVAGVKPGEPYTIEISHDGLAIKYFITRDGDKYAFQVQSYRNETPGSWFSASAHVYQTIKLAEHDCLSQALVYIRSLITKSETPEIYHALFTKIQNKFKIINMTEQTKDRENQLAELGLMYNPTDHSWTGHGFSITGNSIENDNDEIWALTIENIQDYVAAGPPPPVQETPAAENRADKAPERMKQLVDFGLQFNGSGFIGDINGVYFDVALLDIQAYSDRKWTSMMIDFGKRIKPANPETPVKIVEVSKPTQLQEEEARNDDYISGVKSMASGNVNAESYAVAESAPTKNPVSLATIGGITTDRITELQNLEKSQQLVVDAYPFIAITNATTLKKAKAAKSALLKASTSTEKIEKDASKFLNTLKDAIKKIVIPAAKITRDALDKQTAEIDRFENAEAMRLAEEQRLKLEKIKSRTDALFAAGMMRDAASFNIGTVYATPSQVETATDEEFAAILADAQAAKQAIDAEALKNASVEEQLAAALAKIAQLTGAPAVIPASAYEYTAPPAPPVINHEAIKQGGEIVNNIIMAETVLDAVKNTAFTQPAPAAPATPPQPAGAYIYSTEYIKPDPENYLLAKFDMEEGNYHAVNANPIPAAFIKGRALYDRGMKDISQAIMDILADDAIPGPQKRGCITELCEIILKQK